MSKPLPRLLFWTPRILCLLFAAFLSVFALDVFEEGHGFWKTVLALLVHLIPPWIILIVLAFSWLREWVGGLLRSGPLFAVGRLCLVNWLFNEGYVAARTPQRTAWTLNLRRFLLKREHVRRVEGGRPGSGENKTSAPKLGNEL